MALRISYNSPVVLTFSLICTAVYFITSAHSGFQESAGVLMYSLFSLSPYFDFGSVADYLSLFLYTTGHASLDHLLGNMAFILLLGPILEEKYGSRSLLLMVLFTALITAILNITLFSSGLIGASGIVFMFIILVSFANAKKGGIPLTFILILLLYVGKEIMNSFNEDNVSQFAHIAGGLIGSVFGLYFAKKTENKQVSVSEE